MRPSIQAAKPSTDRRLELAVTAVAALGASGFVAAGALALAEVAPTPRLWWVTGVVLFALLALAWVSCAHAGGHAWLVPAPAAVLAVVWAITAASGHEAVAGWWLVGASAALVSVAAALGGAALRARAMPLAKARSVAGAVGVAVTALDPAGVVRVGGETWSAISHSGRLPAGATVHVIAAEGLRLQVWSESGTVPGPEALEPSSDNNPSEQRQGGSQC